MNIHEDKKVILFHNPKTGGQFIRRELARKPGMNTAYEYWGPYSREINTDLGHINRSTIPRFFPNYQSYRMMTFVRNPYDRFISAMTTARGNNAWMAGVIRKYPEALDFLRYIDSLDYYEQDRILRSPEIPWFNPQSYYVGEDVQVFHYESEKDWAYVCELFDIQSTNVKIKPAYPYDRQVYDLLRKLYFDDRKVFEMYEQL